MMHFIINLIYNTIVYLYIPHIILGTHTHTLTNALHMIYRIIHRPMGMFILNIICYM